MKNYGWTLILLWMSILSLRLATRIELPEAIEHFNRDSYACYGCNNNWQPSCEHKSNTVIGVQAIKVGAKRRDLHCPCVVNVPSDDNCKNTTCCKPSSYDCIAEYSYNESDINYRYHRSCSGKSKCLSGIPVVNARNDCDDHIVHDVPNYTYNEFTGYLFIEYACIKESMMFDMCKNDTYESNNGILYLHTPRYPDEIPEGMTSDCSCFLSADTGRQLDAYLIDVQMENQVLNIDGESVIGDNTLSTPYNITKLTMGNTANITLENLSEAYNGTKVWIGIKDQYGTEFKITCWGPSEGEDTAITASSKAGRLSLGMIIGIVVAVLLLLLILLCCLLYRCFKTQNRKRQIQANNNAMNSKFNKERIPENKVEPARFIEEHDGLGVRNQTHPSIAATRATTSEHNGGPMHQNINGSPMSLQPIEKPLQQADDDDQPVKKHKKKKKKHKSRKHKHRDPNDNEMVNDTNKGNDNDDEAKNE